MIRYLRNEMTDLQTGSIKLRLLHQESGEFVIGEVDIGEDPGMLEKQLHAELDAKVNPPKLSMTFGLAVEALKNGFCVARAGWNGKGMWLGLVADTAAINFPGPDGDLVEYDNHPYIVMKTVDDKLVPWLASQTDVLAEDWSIV